MELCNLTVSALSEKLQKKEISAVELANAYFDRIDQYDGELKSYITVSKERALAQAKAADEKIAAGTASPLTGIPLSVKDNICTKGLLTTCGSRMLADFVPPYNATVMERLDSQGIVTLGKGNMDEFAMGSTCQTSYFGGAKNPYDKNCVPGGSSGGGAAAVAANLCAAALGSDTGGSIRQPSSFCGVTGLKPTYGAVSRYGLVAFASSLDQIGPMARSAEDCGLLLSALIGGDVNDATCRALPATDYTAKIGSSMQGLTIGIPEEFFGEGIQDEVKEIVLTAAKTYESMGCTLKSVSLPSLKYAVAAYYLISSAEATSNLDRYDGIKFGFRATGDSYDELIKNTRAQGFGAEVKRRIMLGNYALSSGYYDAYYKKAVKIRGKLRDEYAAIFQTCDVILTPTAPATAYRLGQTDQSPVELYIGDICTVAVNIAGLPAINTPCGYTKAGMPVGMSLIGRAFDEATIIAAAAAFETGFERKEAVL